MNIVLHEPGIALNTGNIGRTCAATNTSLHLIRPYGFHITEKEIRRAGMDYWDKIDLHEYVDYEDFLAQHPELGIKDADYVSENASGSETNVRDSSSYAEVRDAEDTAEIKLVSGDRHTQKLSSEDIAGLETKEKSPRLWFATTKARQCYTDVSFGPDDYIMLGNESRGIPEEILVKHPDTCIRIPMWGDIRSLNLANSAAIILYEALRQNGFENMAKYGNLHRLSW